MGVKKKIKIWLAQKIKRLLDEDKSACLIVNSSNCEVGTFSFHNRDFIIKGKGKAKIGSYCAFGNGIKIILSNHDYNFPSMQYSFYRKFFKMEHPGRKTNAASIFSVEIGSDVWIGDNVCILPNVKIGHGAIVATGSVITKDVDDFTIVGGIPARFIKNRFAEETKQIMLQKKWWEWTEEQIIENKDFFLKNWNSNE